MRHREAGATPDGSRIAFISTRDDDAGDLYTMSVDGGDVQHLVSGPGLEANAPAYSPDGRKIAYETRLSSRDAVRVAVVDADGGTPVSLPHSGAVSEEPSWGVA